MYEQLIRESDPTVKLSFTEKWSPLVQMKIAAFFAVCFVVMSYVPNTIWDPEVQDFIYVIGILGIWRYLWWFNHWIRAKVFEKVTYPAMAERAARLWESGWG
ncbi:MAG TPA: hypothetical protein PK264_07675, partial [Hyphomicrobiaceae bacterium]|nr:hypothetical protein [Hyphomicrobiaceae bacterium]